MVWLVASIRRQDPSRRIVKSSCASQFEWSLCKNGADRATALFKLISSLASSAIGYCMFMAHHVEMDLHFKQCILARRNTDDSLCCQVICPDIVSSRIKKELHYKIKKTITYSIIIRTCLTMFIPLLWLIWWFIRFSFMVFSVMR